VNLTELTHPALAGRDARLVRWELFVFSDVRDVLPTPRRETVVVAHRGPARTEEWLVALGAAGMLDERPAPDAAA
jgi:hypothetical protein